MAGNSEGGKGRLTAQELLTSALGNRDQTGGVHSKVGELTALERAMPYDIIAKAEETCDLFEGLDDDERADVESRVASYLLARENAKASGKRNQAADTINYSWLQEFRYISPGGKRARRLGARQALFVMEFLRDFNGTKALERAGYEGCVVRLGVTGYMRNNPHVEHAIKAAIAERLHRLQRDADRVLDFLWDASSFDPGDVVDFDGNTVTYKNLADVPPNVRRMVKSIKKSVQPNGAESIIVEFESRVPFISMLTKHMGLATEKVEVKVEHSVVDQLTKAKNRALERRKQWQEAREIPGERVDGEG